MKRKWMIITVLITFLIGGLKSSPVLATKGGGSLTILEKIGLYISNDHFELTNVVNKVLSFGDNNQFILPSSLVQSHHPEIQKLAYDLTKDLKTDEEKSMAIFLWVAKNITYDAESYFEDPENPRYYSSLETLRNRVALCSGYANLNAALHRSIGIEAKVVYGEGHAWNEVKISDHWQEQDPTFGSGELNLQEKIFIQQLNQKYFSSVDLKREGEFPW